MTIGEIRVVLFLICSHCRLFLVHRKSKFVNHITEISKSFLLVVTQVVR